MTSEMTNQCNPEPRSLGLMEDLAEILRAEVLPTHLPLVQLIHKICEDPTLKQEDLYSKYTRLAAVVGGDWITVKEELRNATRFGAPAFYCSISAMLAVYNCRRSRSHDELVSSLTELYNHISAGNESLNKQVENAITVMGRQMEHANVAEASIANLNERVDIALTTINRQMEHVSTAEATFANLNERVDNAITTMEKQEELAKRAETSITNIIERADYVKTKMDKQAEHVNKAEVSVTNIIERADHVKTTMEEQVEQVNKAKSSIANVIKRADNAINTISKQMKQTNIAETKNPLMASSSKEFRQGNRDVVLIPGTTYLCKYGTLTIDDQSECDFSGSSMEARKLALWLTLPVPYADRTNLMNLDHDDLILKAEDNVRSIHDYIHNDNAVQRKNKLKNVFNNIKYKKGQWSYD